MKSIESTGEGLIPDIVTDQTSAHDELNGYVPDSLDYDSAILLRSSNPNKYISLKTYHHIFQYKLLGLIYDMLL